MFRRQQQKIFEENEISFGDDEDIGLVCDGSVLYLYD